MKIKILILITIALFLSIQCDLPVFEFNDVLALGTDVYICGSFTNTYMGYKNPCIWKNEEMKPLPLPIGAYLGEAVSIYVTPEDDIYVAGSYTDGLGDKACFWKNDEIINLHEPQNSSSKATSIFVYEGKPYISGNYYNSSLMTYSSCYWINNILTKVVLGDSSTNIQVESIFVYNGDVYTAGYYDNIGIFFPCYWKNTQKIDLPFINNADARSIFVYKDDVYVAGRYNNSSLCYWKNASRIDLPLPLNSYEVYASSLFVLNDDVYISGGYSDASLIKTTMCYWKNNQRFDLSTNTTTETALSLNSIYPFYNNIYMAGSLGNGMNDQPFFLTNNDVRFLYPGISGDAYSIFVKRTNNKDYYE